MDNSRPLSSFRLLSFDIFGTLIDWKAGIHGALEPLIQRLDDSNPLKSDPKALGAEYDKHERAIQPKNPQLTYNLVLKSTYENLARELGAAPADEHVLDTEGTAFSKSIGHWPPFDDTVAAMRRLKKKGYKLVPLSNVDHESFSKTLAGPLGGLREGLGEGEPFFDAIYTAQDIGSYKPDLRNFEYLVSHVRSEFGVEPTDILHVAQSLHHDHEPAKKMGLHSVWIARGQGDAAEYAGKVAFGWRFSDLAALADAVEREPKEKNDSKEVEENFRKPPDLLTFCISPTSSQVAANAHPHADRFISRSTQVLGLWVAFSGNPLPAIASPGLVSCRPRVSLCSQPDFIHRHIQARCSCRAAPIALTPASALLSPTKAPRRHFSPSPLMSFSFQNYESSSSTTQSTSPAHTASQSANLSSPPSSVAMHPQSVSQSTVTTSTSCPTPASSVSGPARDGQDGTGAASVSFVMGQPASAALGNDAKSLAHDLSNDEKSINTQKTSSNDNNDHDPMDIDLKEGGGPPEDLSLESLQRDVGEAIGLCKSTYTSSLPTPKFDIVSLYGLGPIAASVARTDPVTGEKINRLRKSYEGKIKGLGLAGRNKPVKQEPGAPGGLRNLMMWPDEEWYNQKVAGKEITTAEPDTAFYKQQLKAMKLEPGLTPRNEYWEDVLGHEKPSKNAPEQLPKKAGSSSLKQTPQSNGTPVAHHSTVVPDPGRPKRAGRKRSYHDSSFVGYGEGFPDDDELEGSLYSNEDDGSTSGKKKRKKMQEHAAGGPPSFERGGSYGVGMFGIGAR
ncbi:threonine synthase [Arthroderma uncinatum]|uniref:threonine synthase n=1 Tax=Arthroderma uncinatum TaxID=74035 RepID=UPI00144ADB8E|nr:threonine synthase [Arthroderma uncinatum]KAF3480227.1 threonine synthase [Arthroderma uncinatum]